MPRGIAFTRVVEAGGTALRSRFYERYTDHCVNMASRIVYLAPGLRTEEYLAKRKRDEDKARFEARERRLRHYRSATEG